MMLLKVILLMIMQSSYEDLDEYDDLSQSKELITGKDQGELLSALENERNYRLLKQMEIEKLISTLKANQATALKKKKDEVRYILDTYALNETRPPLLDNLDLTNKLRESINERFFSKDKITISKLIQDYRMLENHATFLQLMLEVWALLSANKTAGKLDVIPSLENFQHILLGLCPYRADLIRKSRYIVKPLSDLEYMNDYESNVFFLHGLGVQICKLLIDCYDKIMGVDPVEKKNSKSSTIVNELTWKEIARTIILYKLGERLGLSSTDCTSLVKSGACNQIPDFPDRKILRLCKRRFANKRLKINQVETKRLKSIFSYGFEWWVTEHTWLRPLIRLYLTPIYPTELMSEVFKTAYILIQLDPSWSSLGEWKMELLKILAEVDDNISIDSAKSKVIKLIKLYYLGIDSSSRLDLLDLLRSIDFPSAQITIIQNLTSTVKHSFRRYIKPKSDDGFSISYLFETQNSTWFPSMYFQNADSFGFPKSTLYKSKIMNKCIEVIDFLMTIPYAEPFLSSVDKESVPSYYKLIRYPLSLLEIRSYFEKCNSCNCISEFYISVIFLFENSLSFNISESSDLRSSTLKLLQIFRRLYYEMVLNISSPLPSPLCCFGCRSKDHMTPSKTAVCDRCDARYHIFCVGLKSSPRSDWYCPKCIEGFDNYSIHPFVGLLVHDPSSSATGEVTEVNIHDSHLLFTVQFSGFQQTKEFWDETSIMENITNSKNELNFMEGINIQDYNKAFYLTNCTSSWKVSNYSIPSLFMDNHSIKVTSLIDDDAQFNLLRLAAVVLSNESLSWTANEWCIVLRVLVELIPNDLQVNLPQDEQQRLLLNILNDLYIDENDPSCAFLVEQNSTAKDNEVIMSRVRGAEEALLAHQVCSEVASIADIEVENCSDTSEHIIDRRLGSFYQSVVNSISKCLVFRPSDRYLTEEWYYGWNSQLNTLCCSFNSSDDMKSFNKLCAFCGGDEFSLCSPFVRNAQTYEQWRKSQSFRSCLVGFGNARKNNVEEMGPPISLLSINDKTGDDEIISNEDKPLLVAHHFCAVHIDSVRQHIFRSNNSVFSRNLVEILCKVRSGTSCALGKDRFNNIYWYICGLSGIVAGITPQLKDYQCIREGDMRALHWVFFNHDELTNLVSSLDIDIDEERKLIQILLEIFKIIKVEEFDEKRQSTNKTSNSYNISSVRYDIGDEVAIKNFTARSGYVKAFVLEVREVLMPNGKCFFYRVKLEQTNSMDLSNSWIHESSVFSYHISKLPSSLFDAKQFYFDFILRLRAAQYSGFPDNSLTSIPSNYYCSEHEGLHEILVTAILIVHDALPIICFDSSEDKWGADFNDTFRSITSSAKNAEDLMESIILLEYGIRPGWYNSYSSLSFLPSRVAALRDATYSSVALRLYQLDSALKYDKFG